MKFFRYPTLVSTDKVVGWSADLIRTLTQRDATIPDVIDVFGNVTINSEPNYELQKTDAFVVNKSDSSVVNNYLPTAANGKIKQLSLKRDGANDVIINPQTGESIDGNPDFTLTTDKQVITIRSDGFNWYILGN